MKFHFLTISIICLLLASIVRAGKLFIPMDASGQKNHLKAYGIAYSAMKEGIAVDWLLNYRGGSFAMDNEGDIEQLCKQTGVSYKSISDNEYARIVKTINAPGFNGQVIKLDKAPKIAVYTPLNKEPWDDAVTMALTYAGIPFDKLYADEVLSGKLDKYDWLHLHHEDFTGQYSKFWANYHNDFWYQNDKNTMEGMAARHGFKKVSEMQLAVVKKIRRFVGAGGNLFAMCSATETFDIALAADEVDICDTPFDGDAADPLANDKLDFDNCLAFTGFKVVTNPYSQAHSDIDFSMLFIPEDKDFFTLTISNAKADPVSAMLCQDHTDTIKGFMGQTTAFRRNILKPGITVLGKNIPVDEGGYLNSDYNNRVKYIHGEYGKGTWTFYGGHDPESYKHLVGSAPTDLNLFPNSPGYRLILNNLLLPAAKKALTPIAKSNPDPVTATDEQTVLKAKMYPDPANNLLVIVFTSAGKENNTISNVSLVNFSGTEVFKQSYTTPKASVDLKDIPAGIYQVKVNDEYVGKVVKE